jgi:hypothetical protein
MRGFHINSINEQQRYKALFELPTKKAIICYNNNIRCIFIHSIPLIDIVGKMEDAIYAIEEQNS